MGLATDFETIEPTRAEVEALQGSVVLEFGAPWCGYCRAAQPLIERAFAGHPSVRHIKIEDGSGRPLGRAFKVKLWPTLVFMSQGEEVARAVRPEDQQSIEVALTRIDPT